MNNLGKEKGWAPLVRIVCSAFQLGIRASLGGQLSDGYAKAWEVDDRVDGGTELASLESSALTAVDARGFGRALLEVDVPGVSQVRSTAP
jgi:hypothetical protein